MKESFKFQVSSFERGVRRMVGRAVREKNVHVHMFDARSFLRILNHMSFRSWSKTVGAFALAALAFLAGCGTAPNFPVESGGTVDLDELIAHASELKQPLAVMIIESGASRADDTAGSLLQFDFKSLKGASFLGALVDISVSRNRAQALRFHVTSTPMLVCLSSIGIIISRDGPPLTRSLVLKRILEARTQGPALDAQLASLQDAAAKGTNAVAKLALTDFLLAHHNDLQAIPMLESVAHSAAQPPADRIRAWVDLARAHYWIAEPEKGLHEAQSLIATLGNESPEALAGGNLAIGVHDAETGNPERARKELQAAASAAPASDYGLEAARALATLPR